MRARLVSAAALVAGLSSGCVTAGRELRVHAERGEALVPQHVTRRLEPATGYVLANPLYCFYLAKGGGGGGPGDVLLLALIVGCTGVVGAVDLVALPVQAVRRHGQWRELETIGLACPLDDPAARVAPALAGRMVEEFGFRAAPPRGLEPVPSGERRADPPRDAVLLEVTTTRFERASGISWKGTIAFRDADGVALWRTECESEAPVRAAEAFASECMAARGEIAALADHCVESVTAQLRDLWPRWRAEPAPEGAAKGDPARP